MTLKDNPMVEVVQADRDAAATFFGWPSYEQASRHEDAEILAAHVQAFARHRLAAISITLEEAARVAESHGGTMSPRWSWVKATREAIAQSLRSMIRGRAE